MTNEQIIAMSVIGMLLIGIIGLIIFAIIQIPLYHVSKKLNIKNSWLLFIPLFNILPRIELAHLDDKSKKWLKIYTFAFKPILLILSFFTLAIPLVAIYSISSSIVIAFLNNRIIKSIGLFNSGRLPICIAFSSIGYIGAINELNQKAFDFAQSGSLFNTKVGNESFVLKELM